MPEANSYNYLDTDSTLAEIFNIQSANHRNKISAELNRYIKMTTDHIYDKYTPIGNYGMAFRIAQYSLASLMHDASSYERSQELYQIAVRYVQSLKDFKPDFSSAYTDVRSILYDIDIPGELGACLQTMISPTLDAFGYILEGQVAIKYQMIDDALVFVTNVTSARFPLCNFQTTMRLKRIAWNNVVLNLTTVAQLVTTQTDCRMEGSSFFVDRVRYGVPGLQHQFWEMRFVSNPTAPESYAVEAYQTDYQGNKYSCRGGAPGPRAAIWHFRCYHVESFYLPPNPPSASMFAHFDIDMGDSPASSFAHISKLLIAELRNAFECCNDITYCDKIGLEIFHMDDTKVRQRMVTSFGNACAVWKKNIPYTQTSFQRINQYEHKLVSLTRKYKSHAYDSMISFARTQVRRTGPIMSEVYDLTAVSNVAYMFYPLCAPVIHYSVMIAEYIVPSGVVNITRCTTCPSTRGETKFVMDMKSKRFPILDYATVISHSSEGMINASVSNNCVWGWIECQIVGFHVLPRKGQFGVANQRNGVEVVFRPEISTPNPPLMSLRFNANEKHSCEARSVTPFSATLHCFPTKAGVRGAESAICQITPMNMYSSVSQIIYKSITSQVIEASEIARIVDNTCTVQNPAFKESVSTNLARDIGFIARYCKDQISNSLKACGDLLTMTQSFIWKATVSSFSWLKEIFTTSSDISVNRCYSMIERCVEGVIGWCEGVSINVYEISKVFYDWGYILNKVLYNLPSYIPVLAEYERIVPQYSHAYYSYMKMLAGNAFAGSNCASGMIHGTKFDQAITFNNYMYTLPKAIKRCAYLLASDLKDDKFRVSLSKNDIVIKLQEQYIGIDSEMRVYQTDRRGRDRNPVKLPMYTEKISCVREKESLICRSPYVIVTVQSTNNVRTAFYIKVAEVHCANTRGMMGVGSNTTEVPRMTMNDGRIASSMEQFIDSYSSDQACHAGKCPPEPEASHVHCDPLFKNEDWMRNCPSRRRSFMKACQTAARSPTEACHYVTEFNRLCHMEGCITKMEPKCAICQGKDTVETTINKVQVTVLMSLSVKTSTQSLQEITEAVRAMANRNGQQYEIKFVTFGGRDEMFGAACQVQENMLCTPASVPWNLPSVQLNGPVPTFDSLHSALWFVYANTPRAVEGVGKIYLLVVPEDMDFTSLTTSSIGLKIREDMTQTYLFIPNICSRMGAKTKATMGVRPLLTSRPTNMCRKTPEDVATTLVYSHMAKPVSCICKVFNPFTGETMNSCTPTA